MWAQFQTRGNHSAQCVFQPQRKEATQVSQNRSHVHTSTWKYRPMGINTPASEPKQMKGCLPEKRWFRSERQELVDAFCHFIPRLPNSHKKTNKQNKQNYLSFHSYNFKNAQNEEMQVFHSATALTGPLPQRMMDSSFRHSELLFSEARFLGAVQSLSRLGGGGCWGFPVKSRCGLKA